jgi:hypothetical protein
LNPETQKRLRAVVLPLLALSLLTTGVAFWATSLAERLPPPDEATKVKLSVALFFTRTSAGITSVGLLIFSLVLLFRKKWPDAGGTE